MNDYLVRDLQLFYQLFLIDPKARKAVQLCPFVKTGIMHNDFQRLLRPDGLGIDYSSLVNYNTAAKIDGQLSRQHPYWEARLKEAIRYNNRQALQEALNNAVRVKLDRKMPGLVEEARAKLGSI